MKVLGCLAGCLLLSLLASGSAHAGEPRLEHRWLFIMRDLSQAENLTAALDLLPRAQAAGYNAIVLSDSGLYRLDTAPDSYKAALLEFQREAEQHGMELVPAVMPIGYSGSILGRDPNLAEGLPVKDAPFIARDGTAVLAPDPQASLPGGDFESVDGDRFAGWDWHDYPGQSTFADHRVVHSGQTSVRMENIDEADPVHGHCRFMRAVKVSPCRQYHLSAWVKTEDFERTSSAHMSVLAPTEKERSIGSRTLSMGRTQDWTHDPRLRPWETYHEPPIISLTPDSPIADGERLRVSYYHPLVIHQWQVMCCLSEPKLYDILRDQVEQVNDLLHPSTFFMQHDEIRVANWDKICQDRGLTPGQLLADNVRRCAQIIRDINPDARVWVWSDMFDPMHNARDDYYLVNGTLAGSWEGLTPDIGIVNWANHLKGKNLQWFAERGHEQILAGYYDHEEWIIDEWLNAGEGLPGIGGAMYTTWENDYSDLQEWASLAWGTQRQ